MRRKSFLLLALTLFFLSLSASAAAEMAVVEAQLEGDRLSLYIRGAEADSSFSVSVGSYACQSPSVQTLAESGRTFKTLVLLDNSLSIPASAREQIREELLCLISEKLDTDYFAIGTISEQITLLQTFSNDGTELSETIEAISYQNQDTYITDALYDFWGEEPFADETGSFLRILLISDGVDSKAIGYTNKELLSLLQAKFIPIDTVGVENAAKDNNAALEDMFAISRATYGSYTLLHELNTEYSLSALLESDRQNLLLQTVIPQEAQNGGLQTVTIRTDSAVLHLDNLRVPLYENQPKPVLQDSTETVEAETEQTVASEEIEDMQENTGLYIIIAILATIVAIGVLAGIVAVVLLRKRNPAFKPPETDVASASEAEAGPQPEPVSKSAPAQTPEEDLKTALVAEAEQPEPEESGTILCWSDEAAAWRIILTDVNAPERRYEAAIDRSVVIGYSAEADICINYDRSVSRKQCEIFRNGEDFYIVNHSQSNGTLMDGIRITAKTRISDGAIIKMGRVELRLKISF